MDSDVRSGTGNGIGIGIGIGIIGKTDWDISGDTVDDDEESVVENEETECTVSSGNSRLNGELSTPSSFLTICNFV